MNFLPRAFSLLWPCWLFCAVTIGFRALGEDVSPFTCRSWSSDEGLPGNVVQTVLQSSDGYLWIGTQNGMCRFDGNRFLPLDADNSRRLARTSYTALYESSTGGL